ncbi:ethylene-responsive transcription factor ERF017-like [Hibiscus syriacus]|nr:ethylene-responsive transcription factor ERF017-like [Hibiscus syriacus]
MVKLVNEKSTTEKIETQFKGVRKRKWGKRVSEKLPNSRERIWLGSYETVEKATCAFDAATFYLRGHSAKFNFPGNPLEIACGKPLTSFEILAAAALFANSEPLMIHSEQPEPASGTDSLSPSVSEETLRLKYELPMVEPIKDALSMDLRDYNLDYEILPGFDDLTGSMVRRRMLMGF